MLKSKKDPVKKQPIKNNLKGNQFSEEFIELFGDSETYENIKTFINESNSEFLEGNQDIECEHLKYFEEDGIKLCIDCGCEVNVLDFESEWRNYGDSDTRSSKDTSRCHKSQTVKPGLDKVFQEAKLGFLQQSIKKKVEKRYNIIVGKDTVRGTGRKAIVASCLLYVFRDEHDIRFADEIRLLFGLTKRDMSDGLTKYYAKFLTDRIKSLKPSDLIRRIMKITEIDYKHYPKIFRIAKCLYNTDKILNHSNPQSVACSIIYFYLCLRPKYKQSLGLNKSKFASKVGLSDITITKLAKRAAHVIGYQISV